MTAWAQEPAQARVPLAAVFLREGTAELPAAAPAQRAAGELPAAAPAPTAVPALAQALQPARAAEAALPCPPHQGVVAQHAQRALHLCHRQRRHAVAAHHVADAGRHWEAAGQAGAAATAGTLKAQDPAARVAALPERAGRPLVAMAATDPSLPAPYRRETQVQWEARHAVVVAAAAAAAAVVVVRVQRCWRHWRHRVAAAWRGTPAAAGWAVPVGAGAQAAAAPVASVECLLGCAAPIRSPPARASRTVTAASPRAAARTAAAAVAAAVAAATALAWHHCQAAGRQQTRHACVTVTKSSHSRCAAPTAGAPVARPVPWTWQQG